MQNVFSYVCVEHRFISVSPLLGDDHTVEFSEENSVATGIDNFIAIGKEAVVIYTMAFQSTGHWKVTTSKVSGKNFSLWH